MSANHVIAARVTGAAALGVALLYIVSIPVGSLASVPPSDATGTEILRFVVDHRGGVLAAVVLNGVAWCALMPVAFAGLRELLGPAGGAAAAVSFGCALVTAALVGVLLVFSGLVAYDASRIDASTARLLVDASNLAGSASAWSTVPCAIGMALAVRRTRALPRAVVGLAFASAAIECVSSVSFARAGALAPTGIALLAPAVFAAWMTVVGIALLRRAAGAPAHEPVTT
jgi:hypothetical protein